MGLRARALILCAIVASSAGAAPRETHKLGVEAIEAGRWADAERFFRAAIAERPQEKINRLLKTAYLPHYYLGVALAELGYCQMALESWAESSRQGQIAKSDRVDDLERRRETCQSHLRQIAAAETAVEQLLSRVGESSASLSALSKTPELAPSWNDGEPSLASRQRDAEKQLADARKRLANSQPPGELDQLDAARTLADSALSEFDSVLAAGRQRLGDLNAATAAALEQLEEAEQGARSRLRSVSDLAPFPRRLARRVSAVELKLKEVSESKSGASAQRLIELTAELGDSVKSLRRAARRPPRELSQAVEAFLSGSYEESLSLLDAPRLAKDPRTKPHQCLLRAAAHYGLWVLGGERDDATRDLAVEAIAACAEPADAKKPSEPPSTRFFSPRFVDFHVGTLNALARAAELEATRDEEAGADPAADGANGIGLTAADPAEAGRAGDGR